MFAHSFRSVAVCLLTTMIIATGFFSVAGKSGAEASASSEVEKEDSYYDDPEGAAKFYTLKRAPVGESEIPVERYMKSSRQIERMVRYSTASNATLPPKGEM